MEKKFKSVDEYISSFSGDTRERLETVRETVRVAAPDAQEVISYNMPAFRKNGNLVYFAAFTDHIGFYPSPSGIVEFEDELKRYRSGKGSVRLPNNMPLPLDLISRIVKFRISENDRKAAAKKKK